MARRPKPTPSPAWLDDLPVRERTAGQRTEGRWSCRVRGAGRRCATCTIRSGRSTSRRARRGWRTSSSTCCSRGRSGSPRGRSTGWSFLAAGQSNAETGEDSTHYWFAFPSERWELALAIEADRMAGASSTRARSRRAAGDRRGTGARARLAAGPARPDPPGRHLSAPSLPQPDPRLAGRPRADRPWTT